MAKEKVKGYIGEAQEINLDELTWPPVTGKLSDRVVVLIDPEKDTTVLLTISKDEISLEVYGDEVELIR